MRFRVGPVRFGGGRKASVTAGLGPLGVTVGGGRSRRSGGGGGGSNIQIIEVNWNALTFEEKLATPLNEMKEIIRSARSMPPEDQAIIFYKQHVSQQFNNQTLITVLKYVSPWIFPLIGFFWLDAVVLSMIGGFIPICIISAVSVSKIIKFKKITKLEDPTDKQLELWTTVDESLNSSLRPGRRKTAISSQDLIEELQSKFGEAASQRLVERAKSVRIFKAPTNDDFTLLMRTGMYGSLSVAAACLVNVFAFDLRCKPNTQSYKLFNCDNYQSSADLAQFFQTYFVIPILIIGFLPEFILKKKIHILELAKLAMSWLLSKSNAELSRRKEIRTRAAETLERNTEELATARKLNIENARQRFQDRNSKQP